MRYNCKWKYFVRTVKNLYAQTKCLYIPVVPVFTGDLISSAETKDIFAFAFFSLFYLLSLP